MLVKGWSGWKLLLGCSFLLSSCGYRWQSNDPLKERPSISISFISGDEEASLTNAIAHALTTSGLVELRQKGADFRLGVSILQGKTETIGYRFNRQKNFGKVRSNLVATEGRRSLTIEAALYRESCDKVAYGPYQLTADVDYDFLDGDSLQDLTFRDQSGAMITVLPFSLGQLEPNEAAQQAALSPLYLCLAQKIVDALAAEWCQ